MAQEANSLITLIREGGVIAVLIIGAILMLYAIKELAKRLDKGNDITHKLLKNEENFNHHQDKILKELKINNIISEKNLENNKQIHELYSKILSQKLDNISVDIKEIKGILGDDININKIRNEELKKVLREKGLI